MVKSRAAADRLRRDALIVRLRREGWSVRQIAADPRVRLSHVHVMRVLDRQRDRQPAEGGSSDLLLRLYREGLVARDPAALELWETYVQRGRQHETALAQLRHGRLYRDLPMATAEGIRREALTLAAMEVRELMGRRIKDPHADLLPIPAAAVV